MQAVWFRYGATEYGYEGWFATRAEVEAWLARHPKYHLDPRVAAAVALMP